MCNLTPFPIAAAGGEEKSLNLKYNIRLADIIIKIIPYEACIYKAIECKKSPAVISTGDFITVLFRFCRFCSRLFFKAQLTVKDI